jgi:hypothetical protein
MPIRRFAPRMSMAVFAVGASWLFAAVQADAQPTAGGYRDDPPPQCGQGEPLFGPGTWPGAGSKFVPVPGDPSAYTRCVNGAAAGVGHCPDGFNFSGDGACTLQQGADTISIDNVSQSPPPAPPSDPSCLFCPRPPINVAVTYRGTNVGNVNLDKVGVFLSDGGWAFDSGSPGVTLTADGQPHPIVIPANSMGGSWILQPGERVQAKAALFYAQPAPPDPSVDQPPLVGATASRSLTVPAPAT